MRIEKYIFLIYLKKLGNIEIKIANRVSLLSYTYTSLAYSARADVKIVSQNLGHASTSVTLDTYTHLTEDKKKEQEAVAQTVRIS